MFGEIFKIFFYGSLSLHIFNSSQEVRAYEVMYKKSYGALKKVIRLKKEFFFLFLLQDVIYSCLVLKFLVSKLKIAIELIKLSI